MTIFVLLLYAKFRGTHLRSNGCHSKNTTFSCKNHLERVYPWLNNIMKEINVDEVKTRPYIFRMFEFYNFFGYFGIYEILENLSHHTTNQTEIKISDTHMYNIY